jgi:ankyrin repeat protein
MSFIERVTKIKGINDYKFATYDKDITGKNLLLLACYENNTFVARKLIEDELFNLSDTSNNKWSALHYACNNHNYELIKLLLDEGIKITCNNFNVYPIHTMFMGNKYYEYLHKLCKKRTPEYYENVYKIIELFIERGIDINIQDYYNNTIIDILLRENDYRMIEFLLSKNEEILIHYKKNTKLLNICCKINYVYLIDLLIKYKVYLNDCYGGNYPIHWAVLNGNYDVVEKLIENGADINVKNIEGYTPYALAKNCEDKNKLYNDYWKKIMDLLEKNKAL